MHAQTEPIWIADGAGFDALIADVEASDRVAIDTEFHGERTYVPKLMLVQIATERAIYLVDPLSDIDLPALCDALAQPDGPLVIGHALHNDLEIIFLRCGKLLPRVFDTQIAAAFLGHGLQVGLANLVSRLCDTRLAKDGQMADWSRRPLSDKLRRYAADDVRYLLAVHDTLARGLRERQREAWVMEECARLADGARYQRSPERAYLRVGRHRTLRNPDLGVLAAVAAERERLASELDIVPFTSITGTVGVAGGTFDDLPEGSTVTVAAASTTSPVTAARKPGPESSSEASSAPSPSLTCSTVSTSAPQ